MALVGIEMTDYDPVKLLVESSLLQSLIESKYKKYGVSTRTSNVDEITRNIYVYVSLKNNWLVRQWLVFRIKRLLRNEIYKRNTKFLWSMV